MDKIPPHITYVRGNLATGVIEATSSGNKAELMASTSKFMSAYAYYRLHPDEFENGKINPVMRRYLSMSHADSGVALFAAHFANEGLLTPAEIKLLEHENFYGLNIDMIKKDKNGRYVARDDMGTAITAHLRERHPDLGQKIDRLASELMFKYAQEIGLNVTNNPQDKKRSYFSNVNGNSWFVQKGNQWVEDPSSRILGPDALKLMTALYKLDGGQFLKNHSDPNSGPHTFTLAHRNGSPQHMSVIVPNKDERKSVFCAKTGSFMAGPYARIMCVMDKQNQPHMLGLFGATSTEEANQAAALLFRGVRDSGGAKPSVQKSNDARTVSAPAHSR